MSARLAAQTQKAVGISNGMRTCTIAAVSGGVVTLSVSGGLVSSGVGVLESYTPVVGDTVAVFRQDSSWLVLGAIETSSVGTRGQITGTQYMSFAALATAQVAISFPASADFSVAPAVMTNIDSSAGTTVRWASRAMDITTTGFNLLVFATDAVADTWSNIPVSWVVTERQ